jgi:hypothetical protein
MKINIIAIWKILFSVVIPSSITEEKAISGKEQNRKSFYIMKVIYKNIIYRLLAINVRNVQQSLYTGKCKYILKI